MAPYTRVVVAGYIGMEAGQQIARHARAILRRRSHVRQRSEILRERLRGPGDRSRIPLRTGECLLTSRGAFRYSGHAAEGGSRFANAILLEHDGECGTHARDVLLEALGDLVTAQV